MEPHLRELPPPDPDPPPSLDPLESLVLPVARSRWWVAGAALLGLLVGLGLAVATPNVFASTGKVLVRVGEREHVTPEAALTEDVRAGPTSREDLENELHLVDNPEVFRRVAERVGPERILASPDPAALDDERTPAAIAAFHALQSWWWSAVVGSPLDEEPPPSPEELLLAATEHVAESSEISSDRASTVIAVTYRASDPALARDAVATMLEEIDRRHRDVFAIDSVLGLVDSALRSAAEEEAAARRALDEHLAQCRIVDLPTQRSNVLTEISDLESRVDADAVRAVELETLQREVAELLAATQPTLPLGAAPIGPQGVPLTLNPEWEMRQELLLSTRKEHLQLLARFPATSPEVRAKERVIAQLEQELEALPTMIEAGTTVETRAGEMPNPTYARLAEKLEAARLERGALTTAAEQRKALLDAKRAELHELQACAPIHERLHRELDLATAHLASLSEARRSKEVMELVDQAEMSNLRIVQAATFPFSKEGPARWRFLLGGTVAGALLGVALALARRALDPTIRSPRDAERALGVPVLCVVPETSRWRRIGRAAGAA